MPLEEYIAILFTWIKKMLALRDSIAKDEKNSSLEDIEKFNQYSESLYHSAVFRSIVSYVYPAANEHDRIQYYLDKVSAHERSLQLILTCLEQRKSEYGEIYRNIKWKLIEPVEKTIELNEKPSMTFDRIWLESGLPDDDTKTDFKLKYIGNRLDEFDQNSTLSICIHCEIRLIDYLIEQNIREIPKNEIEIGISKLSCYPCSLYIEKLNGKFNRNFCVAKSTTHGKIYPKWAFRNNEDNSIMDYVNDQLKTLLETELQELDRKERQKSGDSDKQETYLDDDDVYIPYSSTS